MRSSAARTATDALSIDGHACHAASAKRQSRCATMTTAGRCSTCASCCPRKSVASRAASGRRRIGERVIMASAVAASAVNGRRALRLPTIVGRCVRPASVSRRDVSRVRVGARAPRRVVPGGGARGERAKGARAHALDSITTRRRCARRGGRRAHPRTEPARRGGGASRADLVGEAGVGTRSGSSAISRANGRLGEPRARSITER